MVLDFNFIGRPVPKQSVRFKKTGHNYQPRKVIDATNRIRKEAMVQIMDQGMAPFVPFADRVHVNNLTFYFSLPKSAKASTRKSVEDGNAVYKITRPDLTDNLMKLVFDALNGIVYTDDSQIVSLNHVRKLYTIEDERIELSLRGVI